MKTNQLVWIALFCISAAITVVRFLSLDKGFFTFYDEAYFLLKAREVADEVITGKSQWNFLAVHWFPFWDLSDAIYSRAAGNILSAVSSIVAFFASIILFGKRNWIKFLSVCLLVLIPVGGQINYVNMQSFLLCTSLCAFIIYAKSSNKILQRIMLIVAGFQAGLSVFVILPGGVLVLFGYCVMVLLLNRGNIKQGVSQLGFGVIGIIICLFYFHFSICNLKDVFDAMTFTATYFAKSGYHYDPVSFAIAIGLFFRDCIFIFVFYCGAYFIANRVSTSKMKWAGGILYMIVMFIYLYYQKKPVISSAMFFSSIIIIPYVFETQKEVSWNSFFSKENLINAFLFCFPLLASIGTNTALSGRIECFLVAWCFIWFNKESKGVNGPKWFVVLAAILAMLIPKVEGTISTITNSNNCAHFEKSNPDFAKIYINKTQKEYLDKVYDLMKGYGYIEDSSVVFTAAFDYATVLAFNAKLSSNFHQVNNFLYWDKSKMLRPDFIILCGWDEIVIGEELKKTGWGWPEEFDAYEVGTPETKVLTSSDIEQRKLYCRRTLLKR